MKITILFFTFTIFSFLITSCDLSGSSSSSGDLDPEYSKAHLIMLQELRGQNGDSSNDNTISAGTGGFLWKPISESTGNLVILLPGTLRGRTLGIATISGDFGTESASMRSEDHNGGRPHFYFRKKGAQYGTNITVQAPLEDGSVFSIIVTNGSNRLAK